MKSRIFTLLTAFLTSITVIQSQSVALVDFNCDNTQQVQSGLLVGQQFTLPTGDDYYATQIGIRLNEQSVAADIRLAIYNVDRELIFVSEELHYSGGTSEIFTAEIAPGLVALAAENTYYLSILHNGADYLYVEQIGTASNDGVASIHSYSHFHSGLTYPNFPENIDFSGAWSINLGFTLQGEIKTTDIEPENEILEFNTVSQMTISNNNIFSTIIEIPAGETHELRQIGLKKNAGGAGDQIHFAIYNNSRELLFQTNTLTIESNDADTIFGTIPESTILLEENSTYHIAFQYEGSSSIDIGISSNPVNRGIAVPYSNYSRFSTGHTFSDFPNLLSNNGAYAFVFGFVLNGDAPVATSTNSTAISENFYLYPVPAKSELIIDPKGNNNKTLEIAIFDITGKKVFETRWIQNKTKRINIATFPEGIYFISFSDSGKIIGKKKFLKQ
jgi:hypothetical protein